MQFFIVATLIAGAIAAPAAAGDYSPCPTGLYSNAFCCSTNVLGILGLDCAAPSSIPTSADDFHGICGKAGKAAQCCAVPAANQCVLAQAA